MRFSICWLLAATAYVALATAAFATGSYRLADLVWAVTLLALVYAALFTYFAGDQRQAMALGFVALTVAYIVGVYMAPNRVPAMQLFSAMGYSVGDSGQILELDSSAVTTSTGQTMYRTSRNMVPIIRTANAIGALFTGLIGCLIGAMAYRYSRRE